MASLTATAVVDMTDWEFNDIKTGSAAGFTTTKYTIAGATNGLTYQFTGAGLTYDGSHLLTGGVVTGYRILDDHGDTLLSISGFSMKATTLESAIQNGDSAGTFESAVFGTSNNTLNGSAFDDVLVGMSDGAETINGGDGNDTIIDTTAGPNELVQNDTIFSGDGDDNVYFGATWDGTSVDGGAGYDTVFFDGDYPIRFNISDPYITGVEQIVLLGGPTYDFTVKGVIAPGETLRIDGSNLGTGTKMQMDGSGETDGHFEMLGGAGDDTLRGGKLEDTFWLTKGGIDTVIGGDGDDSIFMGNTLTAADRIRGGDGTGDAVHLDGNYSAGLTFAATTMRGVEQLDLTGGHDYKLTMNNGNVAAGGTFTVVAYTLGAGDNLTFNGSAETDGKLQVVDGAGDDVLTGGAGDDLFELSRGGQNIINGGAGDDKIFYFGNYFAPTEQVNGGAGNDELILSGKYSAGLTFTATTMSNVETFIVSDGFDYDVTFVDANVAAGKTLTVSAADSSPITQPLTSDFSARFDGSAELDGSFNMIGGDGDDTLIGGAKKDTFTGGLGADFIHSGAAVDTYVYASVAESTSTSYDTLDGFSGAETIDVVNPVTAIDAAITSGGLSTATFDTDLATAVDAGHLGAGHAVLFTANSGSLSGQLFLIVDQNGAAGYQASADLVLALTNTDHLSSLSPATFT